MNSNRDGNTLKVQLCCPPVVEMFKTELWMCVDVFSFFHLKCSQNKDSKFIMKESLHTQCIRDADVHL